jgi:predicted flap endonuclease-1-like 5' DNA nuclease
MSDPINSIKGVSDALASKMRDLGIRDADDLLGAAMDYGARGQLANKLGIATPALTEIVNRADLSRLKGVSGVYADLLENAGVDTVKELSNRVPANLHAKLEEVNKSKKFTERPPTMSMVEEWVSQAKKLDR